MTNHETNRDTQAPRLAVLIDAENVPVSLWPAIRRRLPRLGRPVLVRAYACGGAPGWGFADGVEVVDAGAAARAPNAVDFLLAFDAGRIRESGAVDGFVLVSGDDGFAAMVKALAESGAAVHVIVPAIGETYGRRLARHADVCLLVAPPADPVATERADGAPQTLEARFAEVFRGCGADGEGWVPLSVLGAALKAAGVAFPGKLGALVSAMPGFEVRGADATGATVRLHHDRAAP
ncbi:NYN domain-containing protein [Azospirillum sp.]|uniref:NYN domain-containing protein n=1 Tax=Azospirillum sp. TaxID=34012 RepID=UPI002D2840C4|nr:NYN domain-containing protein [Azospirillum sp.]HYD64770.1 NYN domain-containing protein [Azospirillum sp.]